MRPSNARGFAIQIAKHLDLKVRIVRYLPDNVFGKLLPREKRILINAGTPVCEQVFSILHECGHYLLHVRRSVDPIHQNRLLKRIGSIGRLEVLSYKVRRLVRFAYDKEKQADLWAICAFVAIVPKNGRGELAAFLDRHPEKVGLFFMSAVVTAYFNWKKRLLKILSVA